MSKDKEKDLDLDFGDISGNKPKPKPEKKPEKQESEERLGVSLPIPVRGGFVVKEIEDCDGEEFLAWARSVSYTFKDAEPEQFDKLKMRARAYRRIEAFHKKLTFSIPGVKLPK